METGRKGVVQGRFNGGVGKGWSEGDLTAPWILEGREGGTRVHLATEEIRGLGPVLSPRWPAGGGWPRPAWLLSVREGDANYGAGRQPDSPVCWASTVRLLLTHGRRDYRADSQVTVKTG